MDVECQPGVGGHPQAPPAVLVVGRDDCGAAAGWQGQPSTGADDSISWGDLMFGISAGRETQQCISILENSWSDPEVTINVKK